MKHIWQVNLHQLNCYAKNNTNFKYILTVIEFFSTIIWAKTLKKFGGGLTHAFENILKESIQ